MKHLLFTASIAAALLLAGQALAAIEPRDRPEPIVTIYATPAAVASGESSILKWDSTFTTSCTGSGAWDGSKSRDGSKSVSPTKTATYTLTCKGSGGVAAASVTVTVGSTPTPPPPLPPVVATTTPPTPPAATTTPPTPPTATTTPPTPQPPAPATCPAAAIPSCSAGFVTPGTVSAAGCITSFVCTTAVSPSTPQYLAVPAAQKFAVGSEYAGGVLAGTNAAVAYAGTTSSAVVYSATPDARKVWVLAGKVGLSPVKAAATTTTPTPRPPKGTGGIQGATYGGAINLSIVAKAAKIDPSDKDSEVLFTTRLNPTTGVQSLKIPLGVWAQRPNVSLTVQVEKVATDALTYGAVAEGLHIYSVGERPDQGIVNNDPMWESTDIQNKALAVLATFPVTWIHDSIRTSGSAPFQAPLLKREQDQGKKIQLVVGQVDEDYDVGIAARVPSTTCPWGWGLPFSKMNLDKYEARLKTNLAAYKASGVDVKAVEVGNELDLFCFNADIPLTRAVTDADYKLFAETYATFLERTVGIVKRPEYYPNAKIILGSPAIDWSPAVGKLEPGRMYASLKNLNGKNYFNLVDGIGMHYYPADTEDGAASVARTNAFLTAIGEPLRPIWVSEWGFYNNRFPNSAGKDRYRAFVDLYDKLLRADFRVVFMTHFALDEFSHPFALVDSSYNKLPESKFFDHYKSPVPSAVVQESTNNSSLACVNCTVGEWFTEVIADIRDFILTKLGN